MKAKFGGRVTLDPSKAPDAFSLSGEGDGGIAGFAKGGADVENFLIQEGVATALKTDEGHPVEPVVYLVDGEAASWFYRINNKKGDLDNLNTPSSYFQTFSEVGEIYGHRAHGWHALVSELSMLAMGKEADLRKS